VDATFVRGDGFWEIYSIEAGRDSSAEVIYELSSFGLRKTVKHKLKGKTEIKSYLYSRVDSHQFRQRIDYESEKWRIRGKGNDCDYWILEQMDSGDHLLGHMKIVKKSKADVEFIRQAVSKLRQILGTGEEYIWAEDIWAEDADWVYYERRKK